MKILCTGDWHFGLKVGGYDFHDDIVKAVQCIIDAADSCSGIVIGGDVFHSNNPSPRSYAAVMELIDQLMAPAVMIVGNHDTGTETMQVMVEGKPARVPMPHALEPFKKVRFRTDVKVFDVPMVESIGDSKEEFLFVPYMSDVLAKHSTGLDAQGAVDQAFVDAASEEVQAAFCHLDLSEAAPGSEQAVMRGATLSLPIGAGRLSFPVVNQHIHKRQVVNGVIHPGSIVATDFSDVDGSLGYCILEVN